MIDISIDDLTTGIVGGTGVYDRLLTTSRAHLMEEYAAQRITGDTYAQAYIEMMKAAMGTAASFAIQYITANNQRELTEEERQRIIAQTALIAAQTDTELTNTVNPTAGIKSEEYKNIVKQGEAIQSTIDMNEQKKKTEEAQILDTVDGTAVAGVIGKQKEVQTAQAKGFKDDAYIKAAKQHFDAFAVTLSNVEGSPVPTTLANSAIDIMMNAMTDQIKK